MRCPVNYFDRLSWVVSERCCSDGLLSVSPTTAYEAPRIVNISGPGVLGSTYGGELVTIRGSNFGPPMSPGDNTSYFEQVHGGVI
jgi:hypothetical protein